MEFNLDNTAEILRRTPAVLNALLRSLPAEWTHQNEGERQGEGTWSPFDIVGHLIDSEEHNWIPRARIILDEGEARVFEPIDREAMFERSKGKSLGELLDRFAELRADNVEQLERMALTPAMLEKRGTHPLLGPITLAQLLSTWTVHDLAHIGQIVRVMAKQYGEAVGPWREFLPILTR